MSDIIVGIAKALTTVAGVFAFSVAVGLGVHCGLRLGGHWFGPIRATMVQHTFHHNVEGEDA